MNIMLMNPRIRQIMPAAPGWREVVVNCGHMQPFSADPEDDIHVWPIVGFALVDEMAPDPNDPHGDEECNCELTRVDYQVVSAMVIMPQSSTIELMVNLVNVDDAQWRQVTTLQPGEDVTDSITATARRTLDAEKNRLIVTCPKCGTPIGSTPMDLAAGARCPFCKTRLDPNAAR
jgi:predicted Zn-ribbon and HTH transcriptional regulator